MSWGVLQICKKFDILIYSLWFSYDSDTHFRFLLYLTKCYSLKDNPKNSKQLIYLTNTLDGKSLLEFHTMNFSLLWSIWNIRETHPLKRNVQLKTNPIIPEIILWTWYHYVLKIFERVNYFHIKLPCM